tara:strand:+ start:379 stop:708 length:330 start_codon:yes stop_codon:yes gene_type:complete
MKWHKKTDQQYDTYMTVMAGGDIENEAHLTENEWVMATGAIGDLIDLLTGESDLEYLKKEYEGIVPEVKSLLMKMLDVEGFDNCGMPEKSVKYVEKLKELQTWKIHYNN